MNQNNPRGFGDSLQLAQNQTLEHKDKGRQSLRNTVHKQHDPKESSKRVTSFILISFARGCSFLLSLFCNPPLGTCFKPTTLYTKCPRQQNSVTVLGLFPLTPNKQPRLLKKTQHLKHHQSQAWCSGIQGMVLGPWYERQRKILKYFGKYLVY